MNWATSDPGAMAEPVAYESAGFVAGQAADVLIVESLQRAEERNAEILAEIVDDGTHGGAITQWAENDQGVYRLTELVSKQKVRKIDASRVAERVEAPSPDIYIKQLQFAISRILLVL